MPIFGSEYFFFCCSGIHEYIAATDFLCNAFCPYSSVGRSVGRVLVPSGPVTVFLLIQDLYASSSTKIGISLLTVLICHQFMVMQLSFNILTNTYTGWHKNDFLTLKMKGCTDFSDTHISCVEPTYVSVWNVLSSIDSLDRIYVFCTWNVNNRHSYVHITRSLKVSDDTALVFIQFA
jgi:hypothetical protein